MPGESLQPAQVCALQFVSPRKRRRPVAVRPERSHRALRLHRSLRSRRHHLQREVHRTPRLKIVNLQRGKVEPDRAVPLAKEIQHRPIRANRLDLQLRLRRVHHAVVEVHSPRLRPRGRNLHVQTLQPDLIQQVRMKQQHPPLPLHRHPLHLRQRRNPRIPVPVKRNALCDKSRMGEIGPMIMAHHHLALEHLLQQRLHLPVPERPEEKHQMHGDHRQPDRSSGDRLCDVNPAFDLCGRVDGYGHRLESGDPSDEMAASPVRLSAPPL